MDRLQDFLSAAHISPEIFALRPDYRVLLVAVSGIHPGPSDATSETLLQQAEASARDSLSKQSLTEIPHIKAWIETYKSFGAKPKKYKSSLEALTKRAAESTGLPRVNRLTDIYNAVSVKWQIPLGGEDLDKYQGSPFLIRATGQEEFQVMVKGELTTEYPEVGEVVWCDDAGVTCRRWNWRQGPRTALSEETSAAVFILDMLGALEDEVLDRAGEELVGELRKLGDDVKVATRIVEKS